MTQADRDRLVALKKEKDEADKAKADADAAKAQLSAADPQARANAAVQLGRLKVRRASDPAARGTSCSKRR